MPKKKPADRRVPPDPRHERKVLTVPEWRSLLEAARRSSLMDAALVSIMYEAGLRASEVGLLKLENCRRLDVHREIYIHRVKGSRSDWVRVSEETRTALFRWIKSENARLYEHLFLFPGVGCYRGRTEQAMSRHAVARAIHRLCKEAGIEREMSWPHALRHSRVVHMMDAAAEAGSSIEKLVPEVAKILGHRSAWTTIINYMSELKGAKKFADTTTAELMRKAND